MTTLTFGSASYSPRKSAVRRTARPSAAQALPPQRQPIAAALDSVRAAGACDRGFKDKGGLLLVTGVALLVHVGLYGALHRTSGADPLPPKPQALVIDMAPPPPPPPPPPEPPKPQVAKPLPAPVKAAPPLPVVSPAAVDNGPPTADSVQVATAPTPDPAPVATPPAAPPAPEPVTEARGFAGYLNNPAPEYPALAQDRGMQGRVLLKVHVLASGKPDSVAVGKSTGFKILDDAAVKAVLQWTFDPAKRGSTPIDGWVTVPLNFKLS